MILVFALYNYEFLGSEVHSAQRPDLTNLDKPVSGAKAVLEKQLSGLKSNDQPAPDAGIKTAWKYAHPANREATGPLKRFTQMLKSPTYRGLLNHLSNQITLVSATDTTATFEVLVFPKNDRAPLLYRWTVAVVESGDRAGEWATTAVSAPLRRGLKSA